VVSLSPAKDFGPDELLVDGVGFAQLLLLKDKLQEGG
jgi:hypothetical protein